VVTGGVALVLAHLRQVPVGAWFSATGMGDLTRALGTLLLAVIGFAVLGFATGLFLRSSVLAVIVGFAYLLPVENVIEHVFPTAKAWLPGSLLGVVGQGGTAYASFGRALVLSIFYLAAVAVITVTAFQRRDVTA
jgi:ABC-2 type transport system permease protein